jgi:STIP1 family protein 1
MGFQKFFKLLPKMLYLGPNYPKKLRLFVISNFLPPIIKGHFFLGLSLMELQCYDEAILELSKAQNLGKEQKLNFGDDIACQLRLARKKRFNLQEEKRICQEIELQSYLNNLIKEDMQNKLAKLKLDDGLNEEMLKAKSTDIEQNCENYQTELNNLFGEFFFMEIAFNCHLIGL